LYANFTNVINTTPSAPVDAFPNQPLNSIPNGALTISWGGPMGNWSGFAGYDPGSAGQPNPAAKPGRGEAEVYAGFIRDGVNFGPGSSGGDNDQPGYSIDITGLKTLFTNTPFVIQLIAASDSMQTLTNAFIIDATHSSTQSVVYPNPQHYGNAGGAPWLRAIGGGLSTVSSTVDADHVMIIGNRAQHGGTIDNGDDYDNASTISGFVITDKPVVTMSPQPVVAAVHDNINLRALAAGVPPLSYQWRKDGVPINGAVNPNYNIPDIASSANYDVVVTNLYGSAISKVSAVSVDQLAVVQDTDGSGNIIVSWHSDTATLQQATAVAGPYTDVVGSPVSPYTNSLTTDPLFYRYSRPPQAPATIESNPYDE
jgi:hypothetical protein